MNNTLDRTLLTIVAVFVILGFFIFTSASLGLLARGSASFSSVVLNQVLFGIVGGSLAMFVCSSIHYRVWSKYSFYIFLATLILTLLVFMPGIGISHGGASRWIGIGGFSLQPAELLKIGFVIYVATWLSGMRAHITDFKKGTLPFLVLMGIVGVIMLLQPDTGTFLIMATSGMAMFIVAGGRIRDVIGIALGAIILVAILAFSRPYVMDRITTFFDPSSDLQGSGYQINQSLIAVGSGNIAGRGFGQSIQKFEYFAQNLFRRYCQTQQRLEIGLFGSLSLEGQMMGQKRL